jgi:hypothetical protein
MTDRLRDFTEHVRRAPSEKFSERVVRHMLEEMAKDCPMAVLVRLGECLIDSRKIELREEAEQN